ncbi:electron transfer flavoprotein beta subunit lysine methyltransferase isoform X2 [Acanthopagrus latus]|uniref:electron transfer flavoprotein beta subunit lysine methyltransferase isoform X2 n=1 Tax=Acanthopagrus latus TaxID=8177 RepID=UPI00187C23A2|nr:electron transfer flavoprotein beta subunit lysine methyltransferase isoform X2 [Acanthopagrus latus]
MFGPLAPQKHVRLIKTFIGSCKQTSGRRCLSASCRSDEDIRRFISENTETVGQQSLTPEVKLRLFTPNCRFWRERPELWPFDDPYWAIYWPGGQALSRSSSTLMLNIRVAAVATRMNSELNCLEPPVCLTNNMIGSPVEAFDLILLGDMFYDEALATSLHSWLDRCIKTHGTQVLIGDPGRAQFEEHSIRRLLRLLAQFELPESVREENYGLTCSSVWCYCPEL